MLISRRSSLRILLGAAFASSARSAKFEVDRLAETSHGVAVWQRRYRASATVTLLSLPVFSRSGVGSGFIVIEDARPITAIQFGAGCGPKPRMVSTVSASFRRWCSNGLRARTLPS